PAARAMLYGGQDYLLWHNPAHMIKRGRRFFISGRHENIISSFQASLDAFARIRHRIAHDQLDARIKFDAAAMTLAGRRYPGSRPGMLLRDWTTFNGARVRWLERIGDELFAVGS